MPLRKTIILISCYFIYGCSDYQSGHKDGYESAEKKQWIVFGRSEYMDGFYAGEAEKFQQDWLAENYSDINQLQCPVVTILADPFNYLPAEYIRVGPDTYKLDYQ
jgi:hypothetical protein